MPTPPEWFRETWAKLSKAERQQLIDAFAPPQMSGGDAGERARELCVALEWLCEAISSEELESLIKHINAALRSSHREGAEAMREACAQWHEDRRSPLTGPEYGLAEEYERAAMRSNTSFHNRCAESLRALPIPGKTDAR